MSKFEEVLVIFMVMVGMVGWYFYWVKPQDELRSQITRCMNETSHNMHPSQGLQYEPYSLYEVCYNKATQ
jgi:hypothetical protein